MIMKTSKILLLCVVSGILLSTGSLSAQKLTADKDRYMVVINHEEQYSVVPMSNDPHKSMKNVKFRGDLKACSEYIEEVWTDMRPLSIQKMNLSDKTKYQVVINHEEQYSIWPVDRKLPKHYKPTEIAGSLNKCQMYIEEVWTDMRPLSVRRKQE